MFLLVVILVPVLSSNMIPRAHADPPFSLSAVPAYASEGSTVSLVLSAIGAVPNVQYRFRFSVADPAGSTVQSLQNYTTVPGQYSFNIVVAYPGPSLAGTNSLVGQYNAKVDELFPTAAPGVAGTSFIFSITDSSSYQRTQTIFVQASGYSVSESVTITIRTQTTSTLVFSALVAATSTGLAAASWKIPVNATIDNYIVTVTGTSTVKNPADRQTVGVGRAIMIINSITSVKSVYQRTETMNFFFQPTYPDGSIPSTGVGLLALAGPGGKSVTLTATYDSPSQTFEASYQTFLDNQTGTWTASLGGHAYSDAYGNNGPGTIVNTRPQLTTVPLTISVTTNTTIAVGQQLKFNATVTYPDGTIFQSGIVRAYLLYSGSPVVNNTVPVVFDTTLSRWIGTYTIRSSDTGGLWSLIVKASDFPTPPNTGSASRAITVQNSTGGNSSLPLFYFGIIAALLALLLGALFLAFRRRKTTHARLKIDLEAVRTEAGRIESSDFFQSVKDQVKKEKDDK
ncbi:MAG TPA: LPXTG cell wall anchor domain-containing protein [Candidatus Bathyarchaeia archaeon]|nr:LPXTG cell wall anchor domain-containing protein [Candidatus Bathyarchaeia archaeon]